VCLRRGLWLKTRGRLTAHGRACAEALLAILKEMVGVERMAPQRMVAGATLRRMATGPAGPTGPPRWCEVRGTAFNPRITKLIFRVKVVLTGYL
jgi:hypothetical protein